MAERLANLGYFALIKEASRGVPLTPTDYVPVYDEDMTNEMNYQRQQPIYGGKFDTYQVLYGQREHVGKATILAEPNTMAKVVDMTLTKGTTTGAGPYTHPYTLGSVANSYTVDISTGNVVTRFFGVENSKLTPGFNDNEMTMGLQLSALGSFNTREIATVSTNTITLKIDYDPLAPSKGLVAGDLVRIYKQSTGAILDTTVTTVNGDGITLVLGASAAAFAAGDMISLRPATTPAFTLLNPFTWSDTQFCNGATAAAALSAAQTRLEQGTAWEVYHNFEDEKGAKRSGGRDPAALVRTVGGYSFKLKRFFDNPDDMKNYHANIKGAWVARHFVYQNGQIYEMRVTMNNTKVGTSPKPPLKAGDILYSEIDYMPQYDASDAQGFDIKMINNLATI
jgi:hypothetical protein